MKQRPLLATDNNELAHPTFLFFCTSGRMSEPVTCIVRYSRVSSVFARAQTVQNCVILDWSSSLSSDLSPKTDIIATVVSTV